MSYGTSRSVLRPRSVTPCPVGTIATAVSARLDLLGGATTSTAVTGATLRAQDVAPGDLFAALPGARVHGAQFAVDAIDAGAAAVLTDTAGASVLETSVPPGTTVAVLVHPDPRSVLGAVSARVYGDPSRRLRLIGITGTSGKTTSSYMLESALMAAGHRVGLIGTVETRIAGVRQPSSLTTPEAPSLQAMLAAMVEEGVDTVVMEVSSHALALGRVRGAHFAIGAFTNLSQDHLDFHPTMLDYFEAKSRLFVPVPSEHGTPGASDPAARAVICVDDEWGERLATMVGHGAVTTSTRLSSADWFAGPSRLRDDGSQTITVRAPMGETHTLSVPLPGRYNVANAVIALAVADAAGVSVTDAARGIGEVRVPGRVELVDRGQDFLAVVGCAHKPGRSNVANAVTALAVADAAGVSIADATRGIAEVRVPGRVELVDRGQDFLAVVDYAHKPAALDAVIATLRGQATGRLAVVVGAGGNRDMGKRPLMGAAAARGAHLVVVTDDNPRDEDPALIRAAVRAGAEGVDTDERPIGAQDVVEIGDRAAAIAHAVRWARTGDVVLVAGKGHETGQEVAGVKTPFDDRTVVAEAIDTRGAGRDAGEDAT